MAPIFRRISTLFSPYGLSLLIITVESREKIVYDLKYDKRRAQSESLFLHFKLLEKNYFKKTLSLELF